MADSNDKPNKNKEVLDLIEDPEKKLSRRERQRAETPKVETVKDRKKAALDIFEDEGEKKKTSVIHKKGGLKKKMPTISKVLDKKNDDFAASTPAADLISAEIGRASCRERV